MKPANLLQPVAIIGMGGMFANSKNVKAYWRTLLNGIDCITDPPDTHYRLNDIYDSDTRKPDHIYCNRGGFLPSIPFDPTEFGIPPAALEATDTSQLLGLVTAKMALADAGYGLARDFDREHTSVILGVTGTQELVISLGSRLGHPFWRKALENKGLKDEQKKSILDDIANSYVPWQANSFPGLLGNVVAGRICNRLNLGGTNCVVDAACASSLSAIHLSLMELNTGKSQMVVTGGVDTINDVFMHMCFSKSGVLSHSGDARPFSADADGTVLGEGIGLLVLKRLEDAEKDGDRIYAIIRGIGSSSDGKSQSIYAPRAEGQARALREAYRNAGVSPETIDVIEAHGTGTRVGDEVEFTALKQVFSGEKKNGNRCALGSVKSMIGHTKAAAGAAGMIKSALALYNKVMLPTIKTDVPDPKLKIESSPFYLNTTTRPWFRQNNHPRRSGVSSFGFGGSNFHVVLEEYQKEKTEIAWDGSVEILAFSGNTNSEVLDHLKKIDQSIHGDLDIEAINRMAKQLRGEFLPSLPCRLVMVVETAIDAKLLKQQIQSAAKMVSEGDSSEFPAQGLYFSKENKGPGKIAFVFPGQGSQYINMGKDLVCCFPDAMKAVETFGNQFDQSATLMETLYPRPALSKDQEKIQSVALRQTDIAQPAIGAVSLAMLSVLEGFNVRPDATCGHSYGELSALCAAGWINKKTLSSLSVKRGRLMADAAKDGDAGTMMAVKAPIEKLKALIQSFPDVVPANINSPDQVVLSGTTQAIASAKAACSEKGYRTVDLTVAAAFHSPLVENAGQPFSRAVGEASIAPTSIPVFSNVTASPYPTDPSKAAELLGRHLTSSVQFQQTVENLYATGVRTFVEVGPKTVLSGLVRHTLEDKDIAVITLDRSSGKRSGILDLAHAIGRLAALGADVDLNQWESELAPEPVQKMTIPLSGTNYCSPQKKKPAPSFVKKVTSAPKHEKSKPPTTSTQTTVSTITNKNPKKAMNISSTTVSTVHQTHEQTSAAPTAGTDLNDALSIVQKGLESIQSLQQQTTQAHQTFLETQAQASRTLQQMMASTQALLGGTPAMTQPDTETLPRSVIPLEPITPEPIPTPLPEAMGTAPSFPIPVTKVPPEPVAAVESYQGPVPVSEKPKETTTGNKISKTLIAIVSKLTGYPEEMLGLEMDIEADLGIDSIKRVEILSTMEEQMPHLPQVTPDMVGTMKTLGRICEFLAGKSQDLPLTDTAKSVTNDDTQTIQQELIAIVSKLTGYPEEMLSLEMDIEADLGIDSIKLVEILSTMEERMPHLPQVTPDMVGTMKTLGRICEFLAGKSQDLPLTDTAKSVTNDDTQTIQKELIAIVSKLTGYPEEMLGLEMDIEADLGIDSIKRVEILSTMEEKMPHLPQVTPDMVGTLKTLGQISDFLSREEITPSSNTPESQQSVQIATDESSFEEIPRQIIDIVQSPKKKDRSLHIEPHRWVGVVCADATLATPIVKRLENRQVETRLIQLDTIKKASTFEGAAGLILIGSMDSDIAFLAAKYAAPQLFQASRQGDALFAVVTMMDGSFGFSRRTITNPEHGALPGLAKTAAIEWEPVICRAIDLSPEIIDQDAAAALVVDELFTYDKQDPVEIGLSLNRRVVLQAIPAQTVDGPISLDSSDVIVITGGAQGVTAVCALALARSTGASIALIGRSEQPFSVPAWLQNIEDEAEMKKAIVGHTFSDNPPTPNALEAEYRKHKANQSICRTVDEIKALGSSVGYFSADVTDHKALEAVFQSIREQFGPVTGLIHGAGVLHDRLIVDKTIDQFRQVYSAKVDGLKSLLTITETDPLRHLVLFSSVSARTGNTGQCDYAMANEVLNKMAHVESNRRSDCRVTAINWGPWDGGMVTPALKKVFTDNGVSLIPVETGAMMMLAEMRNTELSQVEVLIGSMLDIKVSGPDTPSENAMTMMEGRELDLHRYPILASHIIGGKPVVPFALITEWIGHGALKKHPGFSLHGIDDFRLLSGIRIDQEKKIVRIMAGKAEKSGDAWQVDVELRNGVKNGKDVIHSSAKALLVDRFPDAPVFTGNGQHGARAYTRDLEAIYNEILFHGEQLRAIKTIEIISDHGMKARLINAPKPEDWMQDPIQDRWMTDPMVLDGAFQMAIVWCFEQNGSVCLPSYARTYRQYRTAFPASGITAVMEVTSSTVKKMVADFTFLDNDNKVVATLSGYEATVDKSLIHSFKNNELHTVIQESVL